MSEVAPFGMASASLWQRLIMTVLVTALVGPLIGTGIVLLAAASGLLPQGLAEIVRGGTIPFVLLAGYVSGGLQAILCGIGFAMFGWRFGRLSIWTAVALSLLLALVFRFVVFGTFGDGFVLSILVHIVPALAAWWLVRRYWRRAEA
ncbi:MAG: hypothetical protein AB7F74_27295 [Parvibaculaceae bacterium]